MSREQDQSTTLDPKATGLPNVDTDAEHDGAVARKASNASLKREDASRGGGAVTAAPKQPMNGPTKEAAHEASSTESAEAGAAAITVLAKHMHEAAGELDAEMKTTATRGSFQPNREAIFRIYSRVYTEAIRTNTLIRAARLDRANASTLITPLEQLDGALFVFATKATLASQWAESHRDQGDDSKAPVMNPADIKTQVADMHTPTNITFDDMNQQAISTAPAGEAHALESAAFTQHLEAATAAATSVSLGNADASRITQHVDAMVKLAPSKPHSLKAHGSALRGLASALQALEAAKPEMKEKLADVHGQLTSLLKLAK